MDADSVGAGQGIRRELAEDAGPGSSTSVMDLPPVRDVHGRKVWRVKLASVDERTCLDCGETTLADYCVRCADEHELSHQKAIKAARLVRTIDYLREGEYERI